MSNKQTRISVKKKLLTFIPLLILVLLLSTFGIYKYIQYREYIADSPYDVVVSDLLADSATISWKTQSNTPTYVKLAEEELIGTPEPTISHKVKLTNLDQQNKYTFNISDGKRTWSEPSDGTQALIEYTLTEFSFTTLKEAEDITLPNAEEINILPNETIYLVLLNTQTQEHSEIKSFTANRFGGVVVDTNAFDMDTDNPFEIVNIQYLSTRKEKTSLLSKTYASEINCDQNVSEQSIDGLDKEAFADLATRWVSGRGKNYAKECYNDVIYRAKQKGVDPAFALTIWLNESGASNYTQNSALEGQIEDFGIHGNPSVPAQNFSKQIEYFLSLTYNYNCAGLSAWEAWGNMYRWGSCNKNNATNRQIGIDYYKGIEDVYGLVTNGRTLPSTVTGLPLSGINTTSDTQETTTWQTTSGSLCCALKLDNKEKFQGDYENNAQGKTCDQIWTPGRTVYDGKLEYSVEIKNKVAQACQVKWDGVCCQLTNDIKWYPKVACSQIIPNISSSKACLDYAGDRACFVRDGKYQWLPKTTGEDSITEVETESDCKGRNELANYNIKLVKGVNFVGFDFSPAYQTKPMYASELIKQYPNILLVGNFEGYQWKDLIKKSEKLPFAGNDFYLEQNKGYLIITTKETQLQLSGWKDTSKAAQELTKGWNLVGGSLYSDLQKTSSLIKSLKKENVYLVGVWSDELARFNYRMEDEDGQIYGEDILLETNKGIFLKK